MSFTEFYCDASAAGSNINAGDKTANGVVTSANGDWGNAAANRFTAASGTPFSGVSVGDFASVYLDGATLAVYIGRVTAVNAGGASLDISTTAKSGTAPATGATGRTCTTGGAWKGPNGAVGFPFGFVTAAQTNATGDKPRVNFKNNATYAATAAITHSADGAVQFEGYTTTPGDEGRATIDGGTAVASYVLFTATGQGNGYVNLIFTHNGVAGGSTGVIISGVQCYVRRVTVALMGGYGLRVTNSGSILVECETYGCNTGGGGSIYGLEIGPGLAIRCNSHDNTAGGCRGIYSAGGTLRRCIADSNGGIGFDLSGGGAVGGSMVECDSYNNGSDGLTLSGNSNNCYLVENCNFIKNGGWGINAAPGGGTRIGNIINCGFGSGDKVNTSGTTTGLKSMVESGSITYPANVTPWVDPAVGDFRINLAAAKGKGRGAFTQTPVSGYTGGTVGYPDVGAGQSDASAVGSSGGLIIGG